jgi:hypothetical protein
VPNLWTPEQLDAIERRYPRHEVRALVAEIRRLNVIAEFAGDLVRALEPATLTTTPRLVLTALVERLKAPATGRKKAVSRDSPLVFAPSTCPCLIANPTIELARGSRGNEQREYSDRPRKIAGSESIEIPFF